MESELSCYTDGKSLGNPGKSYAIVLFDRDVEESNTHYWESDYATNNIAEYNGLLLAIKKCPPNTTLHVYSDSKLMVEQTKGNWKCKDLTLSELLEEIKKLKSEKNIKLNINWIPREENKADFVLNNHLEKSEPATEKQKKYLKDLGISFDENISKIEASGLISNKLKS